MRFSRHLSLIFGCVLLVSAVISAFARQGDFSTMWAVFLPQQNTSSEYEFYLYHPQTHAKRPLINDTNLFRLRWEPNGEWLWYGSVDQATHQETLVRIHWTGCCRTSTAMDDVEEALDYLYFSPAENWVIFLQIDLYERLIHINRMRPDGSQHLSFPVEISPILNPTFVNDWSSDGQHLFFMTYRGDTGDFATFTGEAGIVVYDLDLAEGHLDLVEAITPQPRSEIPRIGGIKTSPDPSTITTLLHDNSGTWLRLLHRGEPQWELEHTLDVSGYVDHWWDTDGCLTLLSLDSDDGSTAVIRSQFDADGLLLSQETLADNLHSVVDIQWIPRHRVLDILSVSDFQQTNYNYTILSINILNREQTSIDIPEICESLFSPFPRLSLDNEFRFLPLQMDGKCHFVKLRVGSSSVDTVLIAEENNVTRYFVNTTVDPAWLVVHMYGYDSFRPLQAFMLNIQTGQKIMLPEDVLNSWTAIDLDANLSDLLAVALIGASLVVVSTTATLLPQRHVG